MNRHQEYLLGCALQGLLANPGIYEKYKETNNDNPELAHQQYKEDVSEMALDIVKIVIKRLNKDVPFCEQNLGNNTPI